MHKAHVLTVKCKFIPKQIFFSDCHHIVKTVLQQRYQSDRKSAQAISCSNILVSRARNFGM